MAETKTNAVLAKMLDRLYIALMRGPGLNCRPHASRQRIDLADLSALDDLRPGEVLAKLLGPSASARLVANVPQPAGYSEGWSFRKKTTPPPPAPEAAPEAEADHNDDPAGDAASTDVSDQKSRPDAKQDPDVVAYRAQKALLSKLRNLADESRIYEQDTGVHALSLGYPLLSVPPGSFGGTSGGSKRILAPIAFVPVTLTIKSGGRPGLEVGCRGAGEDRIKPNPALMAWLERETGRRVPDDLFGDDEGSDPWREVADLVKCVAAMLERPELANPSFTDPATFSVGSTPRADETGRGIAILSSAVMGLFPASNQGLLRDTREMMVDDAALAGPVSSFVKAGVTLERLTKPREDTEPTVGDRGLREGASGGGGRDYADQRFVALADPCQGRAVVLSRSAPALVMHGPPGTGKSQTITNIIGDHLARGQRVLFVCDKRTALDVVANRLAALGLDGLCAVVHDAQRDQRDLYMGIRAQLDRLTDVRTDPKAIGRVEAIDLELGGLHRELSALHAALMKPDTAQGPAFHDLMGQWLALAGAPTLPEHTTRDTTLGEIEAQRATVSLALDRGAALKYGDNPWSAAVGTSLDAYLRRDNAALRRSLSEAVRHAGSADATRHPAIPAFDAAQPLTEQSAQRREVLTLLAKVTPSSSPATQPQVVAEAQRVAALDREAARRLLDTLRGAAEQRAALDQPLDAELWLTTKDDVPTAKQLAERLGTLGQYLQSARKWWGFLAFGAKKQAGAVLRGYGLPLGIASAERAAAFLQGVRARVALGVVASQLTGMESAAPVMDDEALRGVLQRHETLLTLRVLAGGAGGAGGASRGASGGDSGGALEPVTLRAMVDPAAHAALCEGLERSPARADALGVLESSLRGLEVFDAEWLRDVGSRCRGGDEALPTLKRLEDGFDDLEAVLRVRDGLGSLPTGLRDAVKTLLMRGVAAEVGMEALRKAALHRVIHGRIVDDPRLGRLDAQAIERQFDRFARLEEEKRGLCVEAVLHRWRETQKTRLLHPGGGRRNTLGTTLQQRLLVRGRRAMRLRQVVALGHATTYDDGGGDPLFDMAPVWLASPETVAQVFPREAIFDVVVFDEASQCRLEEALPVLTRAKRVVIAGDPRQLPPTRFFEASFAPGDAPSEAPPETDDEIFEASQGEVEDLLGAALNLDVRESYLDVHYRSKNAELIGFSNEYFYHHRLQAIPGHPSRRGTTAPLQLIRVEDAVYEDRENEAEARRVVRLVEELLGRTKPPSIGIACFNLSQRDLIAELLDDRAIEDEAFGKRYAEAQARQGEGSFEGLFVKNLENVQGDERDHIIISTTYGPTAPPERRFYRRFGPLALAGGGRRLNVLVTRARERVHLVTSIPPEVYRTVEPLPEGATASGAWLLFAYLRYAEAVEAAYAPPVSPTEVAVSQGDTARVGGSEVAATPAVNIHAVRNPSPLVEALARQLAAQQRLSSEVCWGNDGFCVDVALRGAVAGGGAQESAKPASGLEDGGAITHGILCDFARFDLAPDAVEWDIYRTGILKWQGWELRRLWSPVYFRDAERATGAVVRS